MAMKENQKVQTVKADSTQNSCHDLTLMQTFISTYLSQIALLTTSIKVSLDFNTSYICLSTDYLSNLLYNIPLSRD